jgi:hypothetical protein
MERARFKRFSDGSAILDERQHRYNFDNSPDAWREAFAELQRLGYQAVDDTVDTPQNVDTPRPSDR